MITFLHTMLRGLVGVAAFAGGIAVVFLALRRMERGMAWLGGWLERLPLKPGIRLPTEPVPDWWEAHLRRAVPLVGLLPPDDRERLYRITQRFLHDVRIEGCAGFVITDVVRLTIAAQASLLLLHMPYPRYTRVRSVLVYPGTFVPTRVPLLENLAPGPGAEPAAGEAVHGGTVILSWHGVEATTRDPADGSNVVVHEFAHMLDLEDGAFDGTPMLDSSSAYRAWARTFANRFERHVRRADRGDRSAVSAYGARNRTEFFATAVEAFFERPVQLRAQEPEIYAQLAGFFLQDPATLRERAMAPDDGTA